MAGRRKEDAIHWRPRGARPRVPEAPDSWFRYFAVLASAESLHDLTREERDRLRLAYNVLSKFYRVPITFDSLKKAHRVARTAVPALIEGRAWQPGPFDGISGVPEVASEGDRLHFRWLGIAKSLKAEDVLFRELLEAGRSPFALCGARDCRRVFVKDHPRRRYCDDECKLSEQHA